MREASPLSLRGPAPPLSISLSLSSLVHVSYLAGAAAHPAGRAHGGDVLIAGRAAAAKGAVDGLAASRKLVAVGVGVGAALGQPRLAGQAGEDTRHPLHGVEQEGDAQQVAQDDGGDPDLRGEGSGESVRALGAERAERGRRREGGAGLAARAWCGPPIARAPAQGLGPQFRPGIPSQTRLQALKARAWVGVGRERGKGGMVRGGQRKEPRASPAAARSSPSHGGAAQNSLSLRHSPARAWRSPWRLCRLSKQRVQSREERVCVCVWEQREGGREGRGACVGE